MSIFYISRLAQDKLLINKIFPCPARPLSLLLLAPWTSYGSSRVTAPGKAVSRKPSNRAEGGSIRLTLLEIIRSTDKAYLHLIASFLILECDESPCDGVRCGHHLTCQAFQSQQCQTPKPCCLQTRCVKGGETDTYVTVQVYYHTFFVSDLQIVALNQLVKYVCLVYGA